MNGYPGYGANFMGPTTNTAPPQSSLRGDTTRQHTYPHRNSESSSISYDSSRRSSNDSSKPRLSKDQQSFLEREFNQDPKPRRELKAQFAERIGVPGDKVNVCTGLDIRRYCSFADVIAELVSEQTSQDSKRCKETRQSGPCLSVIPPAWWSCQSASNTSPQWLRCRSHGLLPRSLPVFLPSHVRSHGPSRRLHGTIS